MIRPAHWRELDGSPGFYVDDRDGSLHVDAARALRANGYRPTRANVAALERAARELAGRLGIPVELGERFD